jgi:4'-phosphopantetheinyl transferase
MGSWMQKAANPGPVRTGTVHLWFLDRAVPADAQWMDVLDVDEQERALAFQSLDQRQAFIAAHALVRTALSAYAGCPPAVLRFEISSLGRPSVLDGGTSLSFSLTHAGRYSAVAISAGHDLGLDLEFVRSDRDPLPLAQRFFTASEADWLTLLPERDRPGAFAALWTVKEAVLKGRGCGLTEPLHSVTVEVDALGRPGRVHAPGGPWAIRAWSPEPGLSAALAVATDQELTVTAFRAAPLGNPIPAPELAPEWSGAAS